MKTLVHLDGRCWGLGVLPLCFRKTQLQQGPSLRAHHLDLNVQWRGAAPP